MPNRFGACGCCDGCACDIDAESLPTITISGYTAGEWALMEGCCWRLNFTPDSSAFTEYCSPTPFIDALMESSVSETWYSGLTLKPMLGTTNPGCPRPSDYCCYPDPPYVEVGTIETTKEERWRLYMDIRYRVTEINVYYGKHNIQCTDEGLACQYVLNVEIEYEIDAGIRQRFNTVTTRVGTATHTCFTYNDFWDSYNGASADDTGTTCDDWILCDTFDTVFACLRLTKIFATPPTGSISFTSADDCDTTFCSVCGPDALQELCFNNSAYASYACPPAFSTDSSSESVTWEGECDTGESKTFSLQTACGDPEETCYIALAICNTNTSCTTRSKTFVSEYLIQDFVSDPDWPTFCIPQTLTPAQGVWEDAQSSSDHPSYEAPFIAVSCPDAGVCSDTCCWDLPCDEGETPDCSYCFPKYEGLFHEATVTSSQTCQAFAADESCITPSLTLVLS